MKVPAALLLACGLVLPPSVRAQEVTVTPAPVSASAPSLADYRAGWRQVSFLLSVLDAPGGYEVRLARAHNAGVPIREMQVFTADLGSWAVVPTSQGYESAPVIFNTRTGNLIDANVALRILLGYATEGPGEYGGLLEILIVPNS
jgi:hypothetical protein